MQTSFVANSPPATALSISTEPKPDSVSCFAAPCDDSILRPAKSPRARASDAIPPPAPQPIANIPRTMISSGMRATKYVALGTLSLAGRALYYGVRTLVSCALRQGVRACVPALRRRAGGFLLSAAVSVLLGGRAAPVRILVRGLVGMSSIMGSVRAASPQPQSFLRRLLGRFSPW